MDVDLESSCNENKQGMQVVVILVGAPGSGKSTFCEQVMSSSTRTWVRICQDSIANGKPGSKLQCLNSAASALKDGKSVFIDRCNLAKTRRQEFVKLKGVNSELHAVVLDLPPKLCISRSVKRIGHEGNLQGGKAAVVVNTMLQNKEFPKLEEGFSRITFCHDEAEVNNAVNLYISLGPLDILPPGSFGRQNSDSKVQLGIMRFLKKVDGPANIESGLASLRNPTPNTTTNTVDSGGVASSEDANKSVMEGECQAHELDSRNYHDDVPTLAFPSISTSEFKFDIEKAANVIVEKVEGFIPKLGNARLIFLDLSRGSRILALVKKKASERNINTEKFFTHVGDITCLYSQSGLRCNVIANAANWRLRPGGGGVNAAIFNAGGPSLVDATREFAGSLRPGQAVVVPLPPSSPLLTNEGVTHIIHVLGPNMNPLRPNCLNNDYDEGCKVLGEAYSSLFTGFLSLFNNLESFQKHDPVYKTERSKRVRGHSGGAKTSWGSWTHALYDIAIHPERRNNDVLEISNDVVVIDDLYPKAQKHILVLARSEGLDCLADVGREHYQVLQIMHDVGLKWAVKFLRKDPSLAFRLGYHSVPSMRQLHLHVISQDFRSDCLKKNKHWNSFNTPFFRDSLDVIKEVSEHGRVILKDGEKHLSMELRCHRCRSAHPNIPRLKAHIGSCNAPFPPWLMDQNRLLLATSDVDGMQI